tara:strand:+ start:3376 stop:4104 length:729 start_codon:yes stop_codon:yes gene_type:complete
VKTIILAGGKGTRISEYTKTIPKPMIKIGNKPILIHIIEHYSKYGHKDFFIALGHKSQIVKNYFKKFKKLDEAFNYKIKNFNVTITLSYTGENTLTGGRIKRMAKFINKNEDFMFTYGDGVSNVNIKRLVQFYKKNKKLITVTAVRPPARFGEITIKNNRVNTFKEKPQVTTGWINGGFFISNYNFFKLIKNDRTILEREPLEQASKNNQLYAFKHKGFWKCMDTLRDKKVLEKIYKKNKFN